MKSSWPMRPMTVFISQNLQENKEVVENERFEIKGAVGQ
jgi:hypothetical protein